MALWLVLAGPALAAPAARVDVFAGTMPGPRTFGGGHDYPGATLNLVVLEALVASGTVSQLAAQAIAVAVAMPFNFLGNKLWTFA